MQIPKEIVGRNRVRDTIICCDYIEGKSPEEIKEGRNISLSVRRIYKILFANQEFINPRLTWPKARRIWLIQRMIDKASNSKKDKADLIEQHRKEIEGDSPLIDNSVHEHNTYVWKSDRDKLQSSRLPEDSTR